MDLGAALRDAREKRGLSLDAMAARTKIRIEQLRALEDSAFERLPAPIFVRGFIRAYAREVGLDPEAVVSQFHPQPTSVEVAGPPAATPLPAGEPPPSSTFEDRTTEGLIHASIRPWVAAAAVMVPLTLYLMALPLLRRPASPPRPAAAELPAPAPAPDAPPAPVATSGQAIRVKLQVQRPCWVAATADDRRAIFRIMRPPETETIDVTNDLVLRLGDAGALSFSIDGASGRPLGPSGRPVTVRITRENYRDFLAASR